AEAWAAARTAAVHCAIQAPGRAGAAVPPAGRCVDSRRALRGPIAGRPGTRAAGRPRTWRETGCNPRTVRAAVSRGDRAGNLHRRAVFHGYLDRRARD